MYSDLSGDRWHGLRLLHAERSVGADGAIELPEAAAHRLGARVVLAPRLRHCGLALYPHLGWDVYLDSIEVLPDVRHEARLLVQLLRSNARESDIGSDRLVRIPASLKRLGRLTTRVLIVSADDHVEFWDPESWSRQYRDARLMRHVVA